MKKLWMEYDAKFTAADLHQFDDCPSCGQMMTDYIQQYPKQLIGKKARQRNLIFKHEKIAETKQLIIAPYTPRRTLDQQEQQLDEAIEQRTQQVNNKQTNIFVIHF
jgi:hypothetical protein